MTSTDNFRWTAYPFLQRIQTNSAARRVIGVKQTCVSFPFITFVKFLISVTQCSAKLVTSLFVLLLPVLVRSLSLIIIFLIRLTISTEFSTKNYNAALRSLAAFLSEQWSVLAWFSLKTSSMRALRHFSASASVHMFLHLATLTGVTNEEYGARLDRWASWHFFSTW